MKQVGVVLVLFSALALLVLGGGWAWTGGDERFSGLAYGLLLFAGNFFLLTLLGSRLFDTVSGTVPSDEKRGSAGFGFLFLTKIVFLGLGTYVGLALLRLPVLWFVTGVAVGLVLVTVASASPFRRVPSEP